MKYSLLTLLFFALTASASAQISDALNRNPIANKTAPDRTTIRLCTPSRSSAMVKPPLWIVNEVVVKASLFREYIRPSGIQSMTVLKDSVMVKQYGKRAENGVVKISLQKDLRLWSLEDLFKNFKVPKKNWNLPVFVDTKRLVTYTDFYIVSNIVESVKIIDQEDKLTGKNRYVKILLKPL